MQAAYYSRFGGPESVSLREVSDPVPRDGEVLVRVCASSVNFADPAFVTGRPFLVHAMGAGLFRPKNPIPGADIAGRVVAAGAATSRFQVGDDVFGDISEHGFGGFAELVSVPEDALARMPAIPYEEAAAMPQAAVTALQGLRDAGRIAEGESVLIIGASGGIGTFAVQIARAAGARVTAVCSGRNADLMSSLGADRTIDYGVADFSAAGPSYDMILDIVANRPVRTCLSALRPGGRYVAVAFSPGALFGGFAVGRRGVSVKALMARPQTEDLERVRSLVEGGKLKPVISSVHPLAGVPDALRLYQTRHTNGKIVISIASRE